MTPRRQRSEAAPRAAHEVVDPLIGQTIGGKYTVVRLLARGGIGLVYLAREVLQEGGEREVVVKVLAPHWIDKPEARARFQREGQRLGALQHPNIVSLLDCGHEQGHAYMVMEYLVGELLSDFMTRKGRLSLDVFIPIAAQILKGLGYAHSRGLMHRDIKPGNIMLTVRKGRANFVKILDFGMAKLVEGEENVTAEQIVGTANFMAPEQIRGEVLDVRVDVYALGVLFYAMLAGRMPFEGEGNAALLYKHMHEEPPPLASLLPAGHDVPEELIALIHQCLAKDPEARPPDADAIVEALIDSCPSSLFHLPVADGSVGVIVSSTSMAGPATSAELSMFDLTRPMPRRAKTREGRPRTNHAIPRRPASEPAPSSQLSVTAPTVASTLISVAPPRPARSWGLIAAASGALLAGGVIAALSWGSAPPPPNAGNALVSDERRLSALLDQVEGEVLSGEFEKARRHLDGAAQDLETYPKLKTRADVSRTRIAVASTLEHAQRLEAEEKVPAAMSAYRDILAIDPQHAEATAALARLTEGLRAAAAPRPADARGAGPRAPAPGRPRPRGDGGDEATAPEDAPPAEQPAAPAEPDPFLSLKEEGDGIFLPVGGKK